MKIKPVIINITLLLFCNSLFASELRVMFYNVENLFDTVHDEGKNDFTFLPKKHPLKKAECEKVSNPYYKKECFAIDWTERHLNSKLHQISKVVGFPKKKNPDFLGVCEIENENVASMLAKKLGYNKFVVSDSEDKRGVDLAFFFNESEKVKFISKKEHVIKHKYFEKKPTRRILEIEVEVDKKKIFFFVNHWPSLGNPTEARIAAAELLNKRVKELEKYSVIIMGDFNTIDENHPHPFKDVLLKENSLVDLHFHEKPNSRSPLGTYFYGKKMTWNLLDRFFVNKKTLETFYKEKSYRIVAPPFAQSVYEYTDKKKVLYGSRVVGVPQGYNHKTTKPAKLGFSDHFPIELILNLK